MTPSSESTAVVATQTGRPRLTVSLGTLLVVAAVAGFVIVPEHAPKIVNTGWGYFGGTSVGWSHPVYDAALIGTWALLIVGAILVAGRPSCAASRSWSGRNRQRPRVVRGAGARRAG